MTTQKPHYRRSMFGMAAVLAAFALTLFAGGVAQAQTFYTGSNGLNYSVPTGYQPYAYGTYYNSSTGTYYDPTTGQYSTTAPLGPTAAGSPQTVSVPSGYVNSTVSGTYYDASTGMYYDAATGQYSASAPSGTAVRNADGTYVIPSGYSASSYGTYYNPSTGTYYDPATGFYSTNAPSAPMTTTSSGYTIPSGYSSSEYGTYYNPSSGMYYDPATGFYSTGAPSGPTYYTPAATVTNPGVPNTGAGGDASSNLLLLALTGCIALAGLAIAIRGMRTA